MSNLLIRNSIRLKCTFMNLNTNVIGSYLNISKNGFCDIILVININHYNNYHLFNLSIFF